MFYCIIFDKKRRRRWRHFKVLETVLIASGSVLYFGSANFTWNYKNIECYGPLRYFPTCRRSQTSEQHSWWSNMKRHHVKPKHSEWLIVLIFDEILIFSRIRTIYHSENFAFTWWRFILIVSARVPLGWLGATARCKTETRSYPTRCSSCLTDRYIKS